MTTVSTDKRDCKFCAAIRESAAIGFAIALSVLVVGGIALILIARLKSSVGAMPVQAPLRIVVEQEGYSVLTQTLASVAAICTAAAGVLAYALKRRK